ncbi:unnamed protein product [Microthlaspi erraticum]|uniref:Uncharacterized protein n=1 Tax=Microthlaspi erraticum TaxID=1685480 RepID=A0A6D2KPT8_9BRAS|nr:unnamed protein product [Microthlaspi erraticum]
MFHARPESRLSSEVSAKVQNRSAARKSRPGKLCPRSAKPRHDRARPNRTSRGVTPRGRATHPAHHARTCRPTRETTSCVRPRFHRPSFHPSDHIGRPRIRPAPTVPTRPEPDCPAGLMLIALPRI